MIRGEAIALLAKEDVATLSSEDRASLLLDWWSIDADDDELHSLPLSLQAAIEASDAPADPDSTACLPLLRVACAHRYVGVTNAYIEGRLFELGIDVRVEGQLEELFCCHCCRYRTLDRRGEYSICHVCYWEDDGTSNLDVMSAPNHMSLREARAAFASCGAVSASLTKAVLKDGTRRYLRCPDADDE